MNQVLNVCCSRLARQRSYHRTFHVIQNAVVLRYSVYSESFY